ncbi:hypothetical protein ACWC5I_37935 [Kitasatospora sp. NPDC001574]
MSLNPILLGVQVRLRTDGDRKVAGPPTQDVAGTYRCALASRRNRTKLLAHVRGQHG